MRHYVCPRTSNSIEIDGDVHKPAWHHSPWSEDFVDIEGDEKPKPRFRTRFKLLWDDENLYVAAELEESQIWATLTEPDSVIFQDNDFEVFLDPDGDNQNYVELEINAFGTVWDLLMTKPYRDGGMPMSGWRFRGLKTAVMVEGCLNSPDEPGKSWCLEMAIPWAGIKEVCRTACPPRTGDLWRANFARVEWRVDVAGGKFRKVPNTAEDNWCWSSQGAVDLHRPEEWGVIQFASTPNDKLMPDPSQISRKILHRLYYAQRDFRNLHGRWAASLTELEFAPGHPVEMQTTPSYFEAIYQDGAGEWHIGSDGHFWQGESYESKCVRGECEYRPDFGAPNVDFK